ncbi:MAG: peptidase [Patescibacteria group bacterium]|nr:MAG: peptidase [Patescibacteria group bacterium]
MMRGIAIIAAFLLLGRMWNSYAQQQKTALPGRNYDGIVPCETVENQREWELRLGRTTSEQNFERWLAGQIEAMRKAPYKKATYTIPVIVHIIHDGEAVGSGYNIPKEQVESQIRVLNEDFTRNNVDKINTWSIFQPVAGSIDIEFKPATVDPDGKPLAEPGIHRVNRNEYGWPAPPYDRVYLEYVIKPNTIWDPNRYLNIWVTEMQSSGGGTLLGYAQFPEQSGLQGLPGAPTGGLPNHYALTDGVVILYTSFGSIYDANGVPLANPFNIQYNDRGRTTTHEVGHYLGLRHIWGDGDCSVDDYVSDTPKAADANYTSSPCPAQGQGPNSCNEGTGDLPDMFQNYMDYSNDACMNLFTQGQMTRVVAVLNNSPRRKELLTSTAADPVTKYADFTASVMEGCAPLTVTFTDASQVLSGAALNSWNWNFDVTGQGGVSPTTANTKGPHTVTFNNPGVYEVALTVDNGTGPVTYKKKVVVHSSATATLPLQESFESVTLANGNGSFAGWEAYSNSKWGAGWAVAGDSATIDGSYCLYVDNAKYPHNNERVELWSPEIDLSGAVEARLTFKVAYAPYDEVYADGLAIDFTADCGLTFTNLYKKEKDVLATTDPVQTLFVPQASQWREETVDLTTLVGSSGRLVFKNIGGFGNVLYIDAVKIEKANVKAPSALTISSISPTAVTLTWTDNATDETAFEVERSVDGVNFSVVAILNPNVTTYVDNNVSEGNKYYYRVRAARGADYSLYSNKLEAITPLVAPTNLQAVAVEGDKKINLTWQENSALETGIKIERKEVSVGNNNFVLLATLPADATSYVDNTVKLGKTYEYRVKAINSNSGAESEYSNVVQVTSSDIFTAVATSQEYQVNIYPNPSRGKVIVEVSSKANKGPYLLSVYNQLGALVFSTSSIQKYLELDLPKGFYFLHFETENQRTVQKLWVF